MVKAVHKQYTVTLVRAGFAARERSTGFYSVTSGTVICDWTNSARDVSFSQFSQVDSGL